MRGILLSCLIILGNSWCGPAVRESRHVDPTTTDTPIPLKATKENGGRRCEARAYTDGGGGESDNPTCYKLQKKLVEAVIANNTSMVEKTLSDGANPLATFDDNYSALHTAAVYGNAELARLLLDNGANVNDGDFISGTPLIAAVNNDHPDVVRLLLARGADVCIQADGGSAKNFAERRSYVEIVQLLKAAGADNCK